MKTNNDVIQLSAHNLQLAEKVQTLVTNLGRARKQEYVAKLEPRKFDHKQKEKLVVIEVYGRGLHIHVLIPGSRQIVVVTCDFGQIQLLQSAVYAALMRQEILCEVH